MTNEPKPREDGPDAEMLVTSILTLTEIVVMHKAECTKGSECGVDAAVLPALEFLLQMLQGVYPEAYMKLAQTLQEIMRDKGIEAPIAPASREVH